MTKRQITLFSMLPASKKSTPPQTVDENLSHEDDLEEFDHSEQESEEETEEVTDSNDVSANESNLEYIVVGLILVSVQHSAVQMKVTLFTLMISQLFNH